MKLLYIANVRLPTPRAHGLQIMKMCEAFADAGVEVLLAISDVKGASDADAYSYYGVRRNFVIRRFRVLNWLFLGFIGYWLRAFTFAVSFAVLGWREWRSHDVVFSRDIVAAYALSLFRRGIFFEMHDWPQRGHWFWRRALQRLDGIISTNQWKADQLIDIFGISPEKILVAPNGFDPNLFKINDSQETLRKRFNLPVNKKIVLYSGQLYGWKGADVLLEAARNFQFPISNFQTTPKELNSKSQNSVLFIFVGGMEKDVKGFRLKARDLNNVLIVGQRPYSEIPIWLKAADILVLSNSAVSMESRFSTSPIKLFEYMASGVPIVASDLPSIREIVSENEVYFFEPDNPLALAVVIRDIFDNPQNAGLHAETAKGKSNSYSWKIRVHTILKFLRI